MAVRYNEHSGVWEFDSVQEAKSFRDEHGPRPQPAQPRHQVTAGVQAAALAENPDRAKRFFAVLRALDKAGKVGMSGEELAPIAGLKGPQGMAGFSTGLIQYLREKAQREHVEDIFWKEKTPGRPATWRAKLKGSGLGEGLETDD